MIKNIVKKTTAQKNVEPVLSFFVKLRQVFSIYYFDACARSDC